MKRLKILFITSCYPTKEDRVLCVFVREHAKAVQLYNDVVVLHYAGMDPNLKKLWRMEKEKDETLTEGIPVYRVWYRNLPFSKIFYYFLLCWSSLRAFRRICSQHFRPDIIHSHFYHVSVLAVLFAKIYRFPLVVTEHWDVFPRRFLTPLKALKAHIAFRFANMVLPVSRALQKGIEGYGIRACFKIVPNAADTNLFFPGSKELEEKNPKRILFVGQLVPVKGIPYLLQALNKLRQKRNDWSFDIVGDGPERENYEHIVTDLGLDEKVRFHGFQPKGKIADFMRRSNFFVLPSLWENLPCVLIEAMESGLPIVSTLTGGIPEIVDKDTGLLVAPGDAEALSEALEYMLDHFIDFPSSRISNHASRRFSYEAVGRRLNEIYWKILRKLNVPKKRPEAS